MSKDDKSEGQLKAVNKSVFFVDLIKFYLIGVLTGDPGSYDVPSRAGHAVWNLKVNYSVSPWSFSIK